MAKTAIEAGRLSSAFAIRWDNRSVRIELITDPNHPEYDNRVEYPLSEEFLQTLVDDGQKFPAIGYKVKELSTDEVAVVRLKDGRQRWRGIREIWRRMHAAGENMDGAPVFKLSLEEEGSEAARFRTRVVTNRHRFESDPLDLAKDLRKFLDLYGDDPSGIEKARVVFNFPSEVALRNCLKLLSADSSTQQALQEGAISASAAVNLAQQPIEVQRQVVGEIMTESAETGKQVPVRAAREKIARAKGGNCWKVRSIPEINSMVDIWEAEAMSSDKPRRCQIILATLRWVRGETQNIEFDG